jgi:enediyne biosynthesis protein E4
MRLRSGRGRPLTAAAVAGFMVILGAALAFTTLGTGSAAMDPPSFVEEAAAAGIDHAYDGGYPYVVGGGVAAFDCDDDGLPDLYLAGGAEPAALFRNESPVGGALRFARVADATTDLDAVTGAYPLDIDGDGYTDLVILRIGENVILRGLGDCRFERANETIGYDGGAAWSTAFSASWETADQVLPTIAVGDYVETDEDGTATYTCPENQLIRPQAGGATYGPPVALAPGLCPLSMLFSDWDRSGRRDLRVSNDRHYYRDGQEQLWRVAPGESPHLYTEADGWKPLHLWGMGIASQDLTGDGYPEVYLTSQGDNKLQTLADGAARPIYEDIALERGVTAHRPYVGDSTLPSTAWHPAFEDVNNDGYLDLFITKGNVEAQSDHANEDPSDLFIGQPDGTFVQGGVEAGLVDMGRARGASLIDLNADGLLDLVKVVRREPVQLWRNVGAGDAAVPAPMGHWLGVEIAQDGPNPGAIGAWIAVRAGERLTERERTVGGGHVSGQLGPVHAGLGSATAAEVRVTWPDGEVGPWQPVEADRLVRIVRGATPEVVGP